MKRATIIRLLLLAFALCLGTGLAEEPNPSEEDPFYLNPNTYFSPATNNRQVQDTLLKYNNQQQQQQQQQPPRARYYPTASTAGQQPIDDLNRYLQQPNQKYDNRGRVYDPGYGNLPADAKYRIGVSSGNEDPNNNNKLAPTALPGVNYGSINSPQKEPPRQYFENDPRYVLREDELYKIISQIDAASSQQCHTNVRAQWEFETNVNEASQVRALEQQLVYSDFQRKVHDIIAKLDLYDIRDPELVRLLRRLFVIGPAALPPDQLNRYNRIINDMLAIYNSATICAHEEPLKCGLRLDPDLNLLMARSRDWDELQHTWIEWHRKTGQKIRDLYQQLIDVSNYAARLNNFTDNAEYWMFPYESATFRQDMEQVWDQIRPLYEQLHAYVRRKLRDLYGPEKISREAPLPVHVLGNMWGQSWENILDITIPYPGKNFLDVTDEMVKQGYTPDAMYRVAEDFFISMNLSAMPPDFWAKSVIQELPGRPPVVCQPSAWDFCNGNDYRIKMCTRVTMKDFITVHHEMTHIQYFLRYRHLPKVYRDGANPGFHEALSEAISLSVSNPKHMQTLGLVMNNVDDLPHNINFLFALAMDKLVFLPFSLALDMWRWDIFKGSVRKERHNCHWWDLRERLSGVKPPVLRSEIEFDAGSKYHVPANIPYIGYYFGTILEFQIFRALCRAAGQYSENDPRRPLHKCDLYRSKEAGNVLGRIMEAGSSVPWTEILRNTIGESRLDATALRDYFRPLEEWLRNENLRTGEFVGWVYDGDYCKYSIETANLQVYGGFYNAAPLTSSINLHVIIGCAIIINFTVLLFRIL